MKNKMHYKAFELLVNELSCIHELYEHMPEKFDWEVVKETLDRVCEDYEKYCKAIAFVAPTAKLKEPRIVGETRLYPIRQDQLQDIKITNNQDKTYCASLDPNAKGSG